MPLVNARCNLVMRVCAGCALVSLLLGSSRTIATPQATIVRQYAGVDQSRMGAYRALAELSFHAYQSGDIELSAKLARILERTWTRCEEQGGAKSLKNANPGLFEQIDHAMDKFVEPILGAVAEGQPQPNVNAVETAYKGFLEKLKLAD